MRITYDGQTYALATEYHERAVPKAAGFRWNPTIKQWITSDIETAARLLNIAEMHEDLYEKLTAFVNQDQADREASREQSRAVDSDIEIPAPEGLAYLPYQKAGIAYAMNRISTLIGDEMGLGKTIQAAGVINADETIKKVLVICPASLRLNWRRELRKWLVRSMKVGVAVRKDYPIDADIVVINYDIIPQHREAICGMEWDLLVCDESHYLKNPKAQRTAAVLGGKLNKRQIGPIPARRRLFLTGTPVLNRPIELWPILNAIASDRFPSWYRFVTRYCDAKQTRYGWDVKGASNLEELQNKLRETCMVRRLKADVLSELPPKRRQLIELPANGCADAIKAEHEARKEAIARIGELRLALALAKVSDDPADYKAAVSALRSGQGASFAMLANAQQETALKKVPYVVDHLRDASGKVIVFAHHHAVLDALSEALGDEAVRLDGRTPMEARDEAVNRFQTDDAIRYFIGGTTAAGVGLTLTAASHVVFAELDWVPGTLSQAEDRCHRIGQRDSVLVQHLVLEGSIDARMAKTMIRKQEIIDIALDRDNGEVEEEEQDFSLLLEEPKVQPMPSPSRRQIEEEAARLSPEDIAEIHADLKFLADRCDGAQDLDGMGFNAFDTNLGRSLAWLDALNPRQAALGAKILRKYKGQLGR